MLLSSLLIFYDNSSIFVFLADPELLNKHRGLIKFVSSAYDMVLELELASWIWLRYGRNTAEHTTWLGTTGPQVTLEFKCPQTEMPHPDDACIDVMTTEKWRHNDVRGPLAGLPERSHHTLWCTCTAVSENPGHFLISWFAVDPHRAKTGRVERQSLWEGVPWQIYQWSAGLLISPSLPKPH